MISRALFVAAFAATLAAQGPDWAQVTPAVSPGTRRAGAMAFDAVSNRLIAFGGLSVAPSGILNETWAFGPPPAAGNWALLTVGGNPPARWGHRMVRNTLNNRLITFGGRSPSLGSFANDTWEFTGTITGGTWAPVSTPLPRPSARYLYGLAFDEVRNVAILFGGSNAIATFGDTWEYNGATWTLRSFPTAPSAREDMVLVYDATLNRTVLFGGYDPVTNELKGDTWLYDGTAWTEHLQATTPPVPTPRFSASAIYDSVRERVVLFGGFDGTAQDDTYEFSGSAWVPIAGAGTLPPNATEAYSGFDPVRRKFLVFGGFGGAFTNQTWELTVSAGAGQPGLFGNFTTIGCSILANPPLTNPPTISGTTPVINQALTITYGDAVIAPLPVPGIMLTVLGLSNQAVGPLPLPLDLAPIGLAPGNCQLLVSPDFIGADLIVAPTATFVLAIPNNLSLVNAVLYAQGLVLDANELAATPGARAVIGQ